ncbi:fibronectin type III domain-containing protein [Desulfopila sp. IMCC35006]|uniref:fibronectin type III domain-containing protein n=1 Tax=Desulfopila sp. IMCC35006 TaxID=2569542 RepID=UPI0010AC12D0|nr:fibronectin type III domain-containing protein [Desulfopila sp. IMCC35006]TKB24945.1 fibronectin type III domain-containing protein [Desulfopila sp. IMCC35006]
MKVLYKHLANLTKIVLLCLSLFLFPIQSHATDVSFKWTTIPDPLTGYNLYCQEGEKEVVAPISLGKVTTHTLTGLSPDKTYHFWLTAYNQSGESGYSKIVTISPNSSLNPAPIIINISMK